MNNTVASPPEANGAVRPWHIAALSISAIVFIVATAATLPPRVATHFAAGGHPNGWMTREGYTLFMLGFAVVLPWLVFAGIALAGRRRRRFGAGLAAAMIVFCSAMHVAILAAHRRTPPQLDEGPFVVVVGLFVAGLAVAALRVNRKRQAR